MFSCEYMNLLAPPQVLSMVLSLWGVGCEVQNLEKELLPPSLVTTSTIMAEVVFRETSTPSTDASFQLRRFFGAAPCGLPGSSALAVSAQIAGSKKHEGRGTLSKIVQINHSNKSNQSHVGSPRFNQLHSSRSMLSLCRMFTTTPHTERALHEGRNPRSRYCSFLFKATEPAWVARDVRTISTPKENIGKPQLHQLRPKAARAELRRLAPPRNIRAPDFGGVGHPFSTWIFAGTPLI